MLAKTTTGADRLRIIALVFLLLAGWVVVRLVILQIFEHNYYALFALNTREIYKKIYPRRGAIYFQDSRTKQTYPAAINREFFLVYAVPKEIPPAELTKVTEQVTAVLGVSDEEKKKDLAARLAKAGDPYEPLAKKIPAEIVAELKKLALPGIFFTPQEFRYYPEERTGAHVLGFTGFDDQGRAAGRYGAEGYWQGELGGSGGLLAGERGALGGWIGLSRREIIPAQEGSDLVLTIDRTLQFTACERLRRGWEEYKAKSAALVLMNARTGAILAMCSLPDFDPNEYASVKEVSTFNNSAIFTPYEPGSVFKTITMAGGLDAGVIDPDTMYADPCQRVINGHTVRNAERKCYGRKTMTNVLEKSINTGAIWVEEQLRVERFKAYVEKFGFGQKTGVTLDSEAAGDTSSLSKPGEIFAANASFGQGLAVTPIQLAVAYAAVANNGQLPRPFIVEEIRSPDGRIERRRGETLEQVVSERAAKLLGGMLISVVEHTYRAAKISGYYVAGKTGTAQIAEPGGYSETRTNHTFAGFAPADEAAPDKFVLVVKYEEPARQWAEQTAVPVFRDVMKFVLDYYGIAARR